MRVLWPILQDPPDVLIQGEVIGNVAIGDMSVDAFDAYEGPAYQRQVIQGDIQTAWIPEPKIPRGLVGLSDLYGVPKWTGPKVYDGGVVDIIPFGPTPVDWMLVPEQKLILAGIPQGIGPDGAMNSPEIESIGAPEAHSRSQILFEANAFGEIGEVVVPRAEITRRGAYAITAPLLPERYAQLLTPKRFEESTVPLSAGLVRICWSAFSPATGLLAPRAPSVENVIRKAEGLIDAYDPQIIEVEVSTPSISYRVTEGSNACS